VIGDQQAMELTNDLMRISVGQISGFQMGNMGHDRTYITNIHGIVLCLGEVMFCHQIWGIGCLDRPLAIRYNKPFFKCIIQIWQWKKNSRKTIEIPPHQGFPTQISGENTGKRSLVFLLLPAVFINIRAIHHV
jgi:hypothetical protein